MEYTLQEGSSRLDLAENVNSLLDLGWVLHGSPIVQVKSVSKDEEIGSGDMDFDYQKYDINAFSFFQALVHD